MIFDFVFSVTEVKQLLKTLLTPVGFAMVLMLNAIEWGIVVVIYLIEIIVLIPFQVFLILFLLLSKYFV